MRKITKCIECNQVKEIHGRGLCNTCYRRWQYHNCKDNWDLTKFKERHKRNDSSPKRTEARRLRRKVQNKINNEGYCARCLQYGKHQRHHIDNNLTNSAEKNIMLLCQKCHTLEHQNGGLERV